MCYAFSKPIKSEAKPDIANRGAVILTISERKTPRDTVALEVGFPYPANAVATVKIDKTTLEFYTDKRNAFARDGAAVVQAFAVRARTAANRAQVAGVSRAGSRWVRCATSTSAQCSTPLPTVSQIGRAHV